MLLLPPYKGGPGGISGLEDTPLGGIEDTLPTLTKLVLPTYQALNLPPFAGSDQSQEKPFVSATN